jgi:hypothetical protein
MKPVEILKEKNIEFMKKYEFAKQKQFQIERKGYLTLMEEIYNHEVKGRLMNSIEGFFELYSCGEVEELEVQEIINENKNKLERILAFAPILDIKDFSKEGLQSKSPTNLNEILQSEKEFYQGEYGVNIILDENQETTAYFNPVALKAFLSTNIGDAVKWTPNGEDINISTSQDNGKIKISIENKFGSEPINKEIGMGEKIGSKYTELFLETIGGEMNETIKQPNLKNQYGTYLKEFTFPKN